LGEVSSSRALGGAENGRRETFLAPGFKFRPLKSRDLALGISGLFGVGNVSDIFELQLSAFYHF